MSGYICLHRKLFQNDIFKREKYSEQEAWIWLLAQAAFKARNYRVANKVIKLKRGQLAASLRHLARLWKWSPMKVSRFLKMLKNETMIETTDETGITVISVLNYAKYQDRPEEGETTNVTPRETEARQRRDNTKKDNKVNNDLNKQSDEFYDTYPLKKYPARAKTAYLKARKKADHKTIMAGLSAYIAGKESWRKWAHPATWLNGECWKDEYETTTVKEVVRDWTDIEVWREYMKDASPWKLSWVKNHWPVPGVNFPTGCPPEILQEYWPDEIEEAA